MSRRIVTFACWTLLATCTTDRAPGPESAGAATADLAITHVAVVDVRSGALLTDQTLLIRGDRILDVGPAATVAVPPAARRVDGTGRYVMPGLWDMHVHSATSTAWHFPQFIALGVTGVRNMHTTADTALELTQGIKRRLADGTLFGPRFIANGAVVDGPVPIHEGSVTLGSAAAARAAVDSLAAGGADFIKVYNRLGRDAYFAIADEAVRLGIPFVGHLPNAVSVAEAADAGQRSIEHADALLFECSTRGDSIQSALRVRPPSSYEEFVRVQERLARTRSVERCAPAIEALRRNGTWFVPTLMVFRAAAQPDSALAEPPVGAVPPELMAAWRNDALATPPWKPAADAAVLDAGFEMVASLHRAGIPMLAGTDVGNPFLVPGISLHRELELLVAAGLSTVEALQTATLNPARFLAATDSLGTIEPGKLADVVLLDANPLEDIRNTRRIAAVVFDGRYLDRPALDALLIRPEG